MSLAKDGKSGEEILQEMLDENHIISLKRDEDLIVYKNARCPQTEEKIIVKLRIPKEAKVVFYRWYTYTEGWAGRAEFADVLEIMKSGLKRVESHILTSQRKYVAYEVGKRVYFNDGNNETEFDTSQNQSKPGIHFFPTQEDAEKYQLSKLSQVEKAVRKLKDKDERVSKLEAAIKEVSKATGTKVDLR